MALEMSGPVTRALEALIEIPECSDRVAVLVFGSHARGQSGAWSDVDLLVIGGAVDRVYRDVPGLSLDVICETRDNVREKLKKQDRQNNHFLLNILIEAALVWDPTDVGRSLKERAGRQWGRGPEALKPDEARQAARALVLMLRSAKAEPERLRTYTAEQRRLCRMRLDQVVSRAIYLHFKARRRWTSSFPQTVAWLKLKEPALYALWRRYTELRLDEAQPSAAAVVEFTLECLREIA